jgi:hypothetical protein
MVLLPALIRFTLRHVLLRSNESYSVSLAFFH